MSNTDGSDLVQDITKLALNDNFYTWFTTTNQIIDAINPLNIYDITPRKGLNETRSGGNVILDVETGKGLKAYPNDAIGALTLDIENLTSESSVSNLDYFVIEKPGTEPSNDLFKVLASNILPPTLSGNHEFTGTITVNALNVKDNALRLQYGDSTTDNDSGLILDTTSSSKVKFTYNTTKSAWFSNRNIGLQDGYAFLTNGTGRRAEFKYTTSGSTQYDVALEMFMGVDSTNNDDKSWIIEARNVDRALNFIYKDYTNTDTETRVFYATVESTNPVTSTFVVTDKIQIGNVLGSTTNFKTVTDYSTSIIPISNSNGILDSKWTNRYVTSNYSAGLEVGNVVKIYNDTNNQATVVKCSLTSSSEESEAYSIGIVERISGGKIWVVTHGEFVLSNIPGSYSNLDVGAVYYLTSGSPNYTLTKPTTGIVKPVFVATSTTGGIFFPVSAQGLSFGRFNAVASSGGTLISGSEVTADAPNDIFTIDAGSGITLQTVPGSNKLVISASTLGNQPTYSSISTNSGTVNAYRPSETLSLIGSGGIEVSATDIASTNGDQITVRGKYFRTISWSGDSSTNDIPGSYTATSYDDTFNIYTGVGIGISPHPSGNGFRIDATGSAISSVAVNSQDLNILKVSAGDSVLGYFNGTTPSAVTKLSPTANSILTSRVSNNRIEWQSPRTFILEKLADSASQHSKFAISTPQASQISNRYFGIAVFDRNTSSIGNLTNHCFPAFTYNTTNNINAAVLGLQSGTGIRLQTKMSTSSAISSIPIIQINNDYPMGIGKIFIQDTGETITIPGTQTEFVNMLPSSTNMARETFTGSGNCMWVAFSPTLQSSARNVTKATNIPGRSPNSSVTFSTNGITNTNGMKVDFIDNFIGNNGVFSSLYKDVNGEIYYTEELKGKIITFSVWVVSGTGSNQPFRLSYFPGVMAGFGSPSSTFSSILTATTTPQRFTFTINVDSFTNTTASANSNPIPPNLAIGNDGVTSAVGQSIIVWGAQAEFGSISSSNIKLLETQNFGTRSLVTNNAINFTTLSSPIVIDGDTNSSTVQFNIASNSITNNYLATMADNTVKVGTGSTNADNSPQDLAIGANSVLGRVGNGDLKSVNMTELNAMLGTTRFLQVQTDDSGTLLPSESTTIRLKGGAGIVTSIGTNNEIIITNTGGGGGGSIGAVSTSDGGLITGSFTKLNFNNEDFNYSLSTADSGATAVISSRLNWGAITGGQAGAGPGLIFGNGAKNANNSSLATRLVQVGENVHGDCLPFISVPSGGGISSLNYLRNASGGSESINRVVGFKSDGTLVATTNMGLSGISYSGIGGLTTTISSGTATITATNNNVGIGAFVSIPWLKPGITTSILGSTSRWSGFVSQINNAFFMFEFADDENDTTSNASPQYILASKVDTSPSSNSNLMSTILPATLTAPTSNLTTMTRHFSSQMHFLWLKNWSGFSSGNSILTIGSSGVLFGAGPQSSNTGSSGTRVANVASKGLIFTNFNTNSGTPTNPRTIEKDRSCRIGLEILNADSPSNNAYNTSKNTAYITHTYVPTTLGTNTVDEFAVVNGNKKSYKYLIQATNTSGDFYTTELLVQVKRDDSATPVYTTNLVQYASATTNPSLAVNFSISASGGNATISHNNTSGSLDIKLLKYEV